MNRFTRIVSAAFILAAPALAAAQQRPLVTEDPETVGPGRVLLEVGMDHGRHAVFPASGLEGHLTRLPLVGVSIGISSIAEIQIDGGFYDRLAITDRQPAPLDRMLDVSGDSTTDIDDIVFGTKVRLMSETAGRPAIGFRFATKLPNAGNESGLGLDTTDFFASVLVGKTVQSLRLVGNVGVGILGDPTRGDRQNDVVTYGVSLAHALSQAAELVAEVNGRVDTRAGEPPPGTESRGILRVGARYTIGGWRTDAALLLGTTSLDPEIGVTAGFTYVFDAFQVP